MEVSEVTKPHPHPMQELIIKNIGELKMEFSANRLSQIIYTEICSALDNLFLYYNVLYIVYI